MLVCSERIRHGLPCFIIGLHVPKPGGNFNTNFLLGSDRPFCLFISLRGVQPPVYVRMLRMSALKLALWGFLAILGAITLAFVTGLVHPEEKVNGFWLVVAAACICVLVYRFYGHWLAKQVDEVNWWCVRLENFG